MPVLFCYYIYGSYRLVVNLLYGFPTASDGNDLEAVARRLVKIGLLEQYLHSKD